jgi:hypothetical protein
MLTLPIFEKSKQKEWKTILIIAKDNGYPNHIIDNLKTKLTVKKDKNINSKIQKPSTNSRQPLHITVR